MPRAAALGKEGKEVRIEVHRRRRDRILAVELAAIGPGEIVLIFNIVIHSAQLDHGFASLYRVVS